MSIRILSITILILLAFQQNSNDFYPVNIAEKKVKGLLKEENVLIKSRFETNSSIQDRENLIIYNCEGEKSKSKYYAVFTQAKGRFDYFDYLLLADNKLSVKRIEILKYRSEHGGEIASKKWLSQFDNYSSGDLIYGKDISAISGATISAKSITVDVPEILKILQKDISNQ